MNGKKSVVRYVFAWVGAVVVGAVLGSIVQSQFSMAAIASLGVEVTPAEWLGVTVRDLFGFAPVWALVVAVSLLPAFPVAGLVVRRAPDARTGVYFLAGGVGVMCALVIMTSVLPVTPVAAARSPVGMGLMALGGAVGGVAFARWTATRVQ